eukprot:6452896-Prymnesium_polylepis.1
MDKRVPPPNSINPSIFSGQLDLFVPLEPDFVLVTFDLELTGSQAGETIFDSKPFDVGFVHTEVHNSIFSDSHAVGSLVHTPKPLTAWVQQNIAAPAGVTSQQILGADPLEEVLQSLLVEPLEAVQQSDDGSTLPVILVGHNSFGTDWPALYWAMLQEGLDPYELFARQLNVRAVLDTQRLAQGLPASIVDKLSRTDGGRPSYSNSSLYKALCPKAPDLAWHTAKADAQATAAVLASPPMRQLLFSSPPCAALKSALISVDQLVLKVHAQFNSRFKDEPAAKAARKPKTCSYCK